MIISISLIAAGFVLLVVGGEVIVRSAVQLAERLGLSTFVIGAVIIGFGSSTPELVTSIEAGLLDSPGIALGCRTPTEQGQEWRVLRSRCWPLVVRSTPYDLVQAVRLARADST
jgi:Ca2+/Na+ antiporter